MPAAERGLVTKLYIRDGKKEASPGDKCASSTPLGANALKARHLLSVSIHIQSYLAPALSEGIGGTDADWVKLPLIADIQKRPGRQNGLVGNVVCWNSANLFGVVWKSHFVGRDARQSGT